MRTRHSASSCPVPWFFQVLRPYKVIRQRCKGCRSFFRFGEYTSILLVYLIYICWLILCHVGFSSSARRPPEASWHGGHSLWVLPRVDASSSFGDVFSPASCRPVQRSRDSSQGRLHHSFHRPLEVNFRPPRAPVPRRCPMPISCRRAITPGHTACVFFT